MFILLTPGLSTVLKVLRYFERGPAGLSEITEVV